MVIFDEADEALTILGDKDLSALYGSYQGRPAYKAQFVAVSVGYDLGRA